MKARQTRQYQMLVRIQQFRDAHHERFVGLAGAERRFASIDNAVATVRECGVSQLSATRDAAAAKTRARAALIACLRMMRRAARAISLDTAGLEDKFRFPDSQADQAYITAGRVFARDAPAFERQFIEHGMPKTFLADLDDVVERFDQAIRLRDARHRDSAAARAGIATALASGLAAARSLDAAMINGVREDDPVAFAVWQRNRRVGYRLRRGVGV